MMNAFYNSECHFRSNVKQKIKEIHCHLELNLNNVLYCIGVQFILEKNAFSSVDH